MPEQDTRRVFRSLLSAVSYLHLRGIVHNDIKYAHAYTKGFMLSSDVSHRPANIMLTARNVPVLIDFGFGEVYDLTSPEAFHSNLKYGTPEVRSSALQSPLVVLIYVHCSTWLPNVLEACRMIRVRQTFGPSVFHSLRSSLGEHPLKSPPWMAMISRPRNTCKDTGIGP